AGRDLEVIFEVSLIAVVHQVNAGVYVAVAHARELRNVAMPLGGIVADEVIAFAGKLDVTRRFHGGSGSDQLHAHHRTCRIFRIGGRMLESEHSLVRGEIKSVTAATCQESHARVGLSAVRLKDQRKMAISGQNLLGLSCAGSKHRMGWMGSKKRLGICGVSDPGLGCTRTDGESDGSDY